jgi:hypothetical protein
MSAKPQEPERVGSRKYSYGGEIDWEEEIWPQYYLDLINWQEKRIAQLEAELAKAWHAWEAEYLANQRRGDAVPLDMPPRI